jgi:excisionase family DNA binding protein
MGLMTLPEAAEFLRISERTLQDHVAAGEIRYIAIGSGVKRRKKLFDETDLAEFIEGRKTVEAPKCQSTSRKVARRTSTISNIGEIVTPATRGRRTSEMPNDLKPASGQVRKRRWTPPSVPVGSH